MKKTLAQYSIFIVLLFLAGCEAAEPSQLEKWGLGKVESEYVSLNRDYDWFIDQNTTGLGSSRNCVPTCAIMAAKWSDADFSRTVADIRNETYLRNSSGVIAGMTINDIYHWLSANGIPCRREYNRNLGLSSMKEHLDNGEIMIVAINMYNITYNKNKEQRTGKHYFSFQGRAILLELANHAVVVKGYRVVDGVTYFEVYDPASSERYPDGTYKGMDRYFLAEQVINSARDFGGDYLIVSPKDTGEIAAQAAFIH